LYFKGGGSYFEDEGNLDDYFDDNGQMQSIKANSKFGSNPSS